MAGLEDWFSLSGATLADFQTTDTITPPAGSKSSNLNLATYAASMSDNPENIVETYRTINAEMDATGQSDTADQLVEQAKARSMQLNQRALIDVLTSAEYTDEQKQQFALDALDENSRQYSMRNTVSVESLSAPVVNESVGAETARVDVAGMLDQINEIKRQQQIILNEELNKENPEMIKAVGDFVGYMLPFAGGKVGGEILSKLRDGDPTAYAEALALTGTAKMDIREILNRTPPEERLEVTQMVANLITNSSTIVLPDGNDYARKDYLQTVLDQGSYDDTDKWIDNIISILDVTGVGGLFGRAVKGSAIAERVVAKTSDVTKRLVKSRVQPTSIANNYKDTNPDKAKATFDIAMSDETEEGAQALYGANKNDVVSDTLMPELRNEDGTVMAKVGDPDRTMQLQDAGDLNILDYAAHDGKIYYFQSEKANATARVVENFQQAVGMNARKEMFQVAETGDGVSIRAVYGPPQQGYTNAEDALSMAKWALRDYGVADENIKLMVREGDAYRTVGPEEFDRYVTKDVVKGGPGGAMGMALERKPKDYLVAVDYNYNIRPGDVAEWAEADVKYNIFDRLGLGLGNNAGSLQRHMTDIHSLLNPTITKAASAAIDRAAGIEKELLDSAKLFADKVAAAEPELRGTMDKLIREANEQGKEFNYNEMVAAGLRDTEIEGMKQWRNYWDNMYRLENADAAKTLRARGFYEYVDEASDTRLFAKPVARNQVGKVGKVLDPTTGQVRRFTDDELKALYEADGTIAQLRRPMNIGDEAVEFIYSINAPGKNYLRAISDTSQVLNYRKGYYSVKYTDPYFIVKRVANSRGELLYTKAVATAGSRMDAEALALSKAEADGAEYFVRQDIKGSSANADDTWDLFQARGRSAQRIRGERLEEPDSYVTDPSMSNILDPVDSMIVAARSAANRVAMRDMVETTKQRFINQYQEFLPTGDYGQKVMPGSIKEVAYRGEQAENAKKLGDARTTFEYIKYLEDGYINHVDDFYKTALKNLADIAGNVGWDKADKGLRWMSDRRGPSAMGKNLAFNMYLATNPLRQFVVQSHQALQLVANFPGYMLSGRMTPQITVLMAKQMGIKPTKTLLDGAGWSAKEADEVYDQFRKTGQVAAIDKQNLVRGSLLDLADQMSLGKTIVGRSWKVATAPITFSRRVGFDAGENINTMSSWLAHRDQAMKAGRDVSRTDVQADIAASARNYTYNMNFAGDMPYNQNALAAVFQFMQVPHKAMLGMITNRVLTPRQKLRLAAFNGFMFTLPPAAMYDWFGDVLPEDPEARSLVVQGFEGYTLNKLLTLSTGEETTVDWSGLSPVDMYGTFEFIHALFTESPGVALASTPSGQLLFGNNPRLTNFAKSAARYFNLIDDYQDPTTYGQVALEFAKMSSGFSNAFKAAYALEYNKKYGQLGTTNSNIPTPNAIAMVFGFQSLEDAQTRYVNNELYTKSKEFEEDVRKVYRETKNHILSKHPGAGAADIITQVPAEAWRVFGNDNFKAKQIIQQQLRNDLSDKDARLYQNLLRNHEIFSAEEMESLLDAAKFESEEKRQQAKQTLNFMRKYKDEE